MRVLHSRAGVAAVLLFFLCGCSVGRLPETVRETSPVVDTVRPAWFCRSALQNLAELRYPTAEGTAYGSLENFLSPPSVYETSWSLRSLRLLQAPSRTVVSATAATLDAAIRLPSAAGLPELSVLSDAVEGLVALGAPIPAREVAAALTRLRRGTGYALRQSSGATTSGTALALQVEHEAGLPVPASLVTSTVVAVLRDIDSDAAARDVAAADLGTIAEVLPASLVARTRSAVASFVAAERAAAVRLAASPVTVDVLASLATIAGRYGITWVPMQEGWYGPMEVAGGALADGPGALPDPQATFDALVSGYRPPRGLPAAIAVGEGPAGWAGTVLPPTTLSTYQSAAILSWCRSTSTLVAVRPTVRAWLAALDNPSTAVAPAHIVGTYALVLLARLTRNEVAPATARALGEALSATLARIWTGRTPNPSTLSVQLALAAALDVRLDGPAAVAIRRELALAERGPLATPVVLILANAAAALGDPSIRERAAALVERLRVGDD